MRREVAVTIALCLLAGCTLQRTAGPTSFSSGHSITMYPVATVHADVKDSEHIDILLTKHSIRYSADGNERGMVYRVQEKDKARARSLLKKDAQARGYRIALTEQ
jgi:hypothetical protein